MKIRRWLTVLTATVLLLALICQLWAMAAGQPVDLTRECDLTVNPCGKETDKEMAEELAKADIVVDLYKVADLTALTGYDGYDFSPIAPFDGVAIPQAATDGDWAAPAQQAAEIALRPTVIKPVSTVNAGAKVKLESGLYLLVAHQKGDTDYVDTVTGEGGEEAIVTRVKTDKYVYIFAPELVAMPNKLPADGGSQDEWLYEWTVTLKPERSDLKAALEIVKTLQTYETSGPATFVFQLDWEADGRQHSDVRTLVFDAPGRRSLLVEDLPVGATVTVTEVYSGACYRLVSDGTQTAVISADEIARVEFVNDYDDTSNGGGSITNKFTYDGQAWDVTQQFDRTAME